MLMYLQLAKLKYLQLVFRFAQYIYSIIKNLENPLKKDEEEKKEY